MFPLIFITTFQFKVLFITPVKGRTPASQRTARSNEPPKEVTKQASRSTGRNAIVLGSKQDSVDRSEVVCYSQHSK